ncbi:MAG: RNA polymerase sigma factor [Proteobacteria bacterium]|nr:RNA polymerase sigma factor [Pseudomonadota bacterium]
MSALRDLELLFATEGPRLRRFLRRFGPKVSAEDIAQDSFTRLLSVDPDTIQSRRAYLFRIARNLAINEKKRAELLDIAPVGDPSMLNCAIEAPDPEQQVMAGDLLARLYEALHELPERQRVALILFKLEGRSYKEIGKRLGVSPRSVERYVADGLAQCNARFRAKMAEDDR